MFCGKKIAGMCVWEKMSEAGRKNIRYFKNVNGARE